MNQTGLFVKTRGNTTLPPLVSMQSAQNRSQLLQTHSFCNPPTHPTDKMVFVGTLFHPAINAAECGSDNWISSTVRTKTNSDNSMHTQPACLSMPYTRGPSPCTHIQTFLYSPSFTAFCFK